MTPVRLPACLAALLATFALGACNDSNREADLEKQLAQAKAQAQSEAAALQQANERADAATRDQTRNADLSSFYAASAPGDNASTADPGNPDHIAPPPNANTGQ